ncbi:MAG: LysR family transcriptional regulator [Thalassovita sp.]
MSTLLAVVQSGSYAQASRQQNLTAATVAQRIRALETDLKLTLFIRSGHTVVPTDSCRALLPRIQRIVEEASQLRGDADENGLSGPLRLGAISTVLTDYAPAIVDRFAQSAPNAKLTILPGTSAQLYQDLRAGNLDLAMISAPPFALPKSLISYPIADQSLVLVVPESEPSNDIAAICARHQMLVYDRQAWGGKIIWDRLAAMAVPIDILCELDALETIVSLVAGGTGVALLPQWQGLSTQGGVRLVPCDGPKRQIVAVAARGAARPALIDLCLNSCKVSAW